MLICGNEAQRNLQRTRQRTGRDIGKHLVPDHLLHAIGYIRIETARRERIRELLKPLDIAGHAAHVGHTAATMLRHTEAGDACVMLCRTDDDVLLRYELPEHILVAAAVLQGHKIGLRTDDATVVMQRALAEHRLHEHNNQIDRRHPLGGQHRMWMIHLRRPIRLLHLEAICIDLLYDLCVDVDNRHLVVPAQVRTVQTTHGACT